ncbi:MAG: TetR family transcriptional regulator [Shewanella sp.]
MSDQRTRMKPEVRREQILAAAIVVANEQGYNALTRDGVAKAAGVATGQVNHIFNTMAQLRRAVMRAAVHRELLPIVAQGLAQGDKDAHAAPDWLKRKALDSLIA